MQLAASFGWSGFACDKSVDLQQTLETSFVTDGPSLVVIPIDYRENMILTRKLGEITATI